MNIFDQKLKEYGYYPLTTEEISILCVLVGYKCNLRCTHCCVDASPDRTEDMSLSTINKILNILRTNREITSVEVTGGLPELNPYFKYFVKSASDMGKKVMVASNVMIYSDWSKINLKLSKNCARRLT